MAFFSGVLCGNYNKYLQNSQHSTLCRAKDKNNIFYAAYYVHTVARVKPDNDKVLNVVNSEAIHRMFVKFFRPHHPLLSSVLVVAALSAGPFAYAGISYQINQTLAIAGASITIEGVFFNDTDAPQTWTVPEHLNLQWHTPDNNVVNSQAQLQGKGATVNIPINNFVKFRWQTTVPGESTGLQTVSVEGAETLLALNTSPALPDKAKDVVVAEPVTAAKTITSPSGVSSYEPVYFDIGNRGGRNARYQVSLKYRLFTPEDHTQPQFIDNFYLAYTQTALWDLSSKSKPFVDTSFKPSFFWRHGALWQSPGKHWFAGMAAGVEHESNGKSGTDSRSLNFAYVQPELNYRFDNGSTLSFSPRVKAYFKVAAENHNYRDYAGNVDWKLRYAQDNGLVLTGLYRHGQSGHKATTLEAAWPLRRTFLNMNGYLHVQYFQGYGQTLLGYDQKNKSQIRIGLALVP